MNASITNLNPDWPASGPCLPLHGLDSLTGSARRARLRLLAALGSQYLALCGANDVLRVRVAAAGPDERAQVLALRA